MNRKTLIAAFDVSRLSETEADQLYGEVVVQAEASDDRHPDVQNVVMLYTDLPLSLVQGAIEIAAEGAPEPELGLMVCLDGSQEAFIDLRDGDDAFNREAERTAFDKAYEMKEQDPDTVVSIVVTRRDGV